MKWVLIAVAALFVLVALMALVGALLPKGHVASVRARFRAAPEAVFRVISDYARYGEWRSDVKSIDSLPPRDGHAMFRENGKHGAITFEVMESTAPSRMKLRIADEKLPFGGSWTYALEPSSEGSSLTITEDGEVYNPLFRFLSKFVFGQTGTIVSYLNALGKKLGEEVTPEVVATA